MSANLLNGVVSFDVLVIIGIGFSDTKTVTHCMKQN